MPKRKGTENAANPNAEYWDTCIFLDILNNQGDRGKDAGALFQDTVIGKRQVYTSLLTITEVTFTLAENSGTMNLNAEEEKKIDRFWHPESPIRLIELTPQIAKRARDIKRTCLAHHPSIPLFLYDALHLASAQWAKVSRFYTYDKFNRRPGDAKPAMPDQRPNLTKIVGFEVIAPNLKLLRF